MEALIIIVAAAGLGLGIRQMFSSGFKKRDAEMQKLALEYGLAFKSESADGTIANELSGNNPLYQPHILNELRGSINNHSVLISDLLEGSNRGRVRVTQLMVDGVAKKLQDSILFDSPLASADTFRKNLDQLKIS